ncbi:hypothetical protein BGZ73_005378 [Actinomortierella ambigua]|nr:hypothetical protein BGZ73_005378 [Actinomortierella ambigua]
MASQLQVVIVGAGIAGLVTAIMFERAGIQYQILERASEHRNKELGSTLTMTATVLRLLDQLGVLEDLQPFCRPMSSMTVLDDNLKPFGLVDFTDLKDRYGYHSIVLSRVDLMACLFAHVPPERITWGKRVLNSVTEENKVTLHCSDKSTITADVVIGADGAYSSVRQNMYKNMIKQGLKVPEIDIAPLRFDQHCTVGTAEDLDPQMFPEIDDAFCQFRFLHSTKTPFTVWVAPLPGRRLSWGISGKLVNPETHLEETFKASEWEYEDAAKEMQKACEHLVCPYGGTMKDVFAKSRPETTSKIMLEEKWFKTWYHERTVLIGDACHKVVPFGGQGAVQAILDAVSLVNLLYEIPSTSSEDITKVFAAYYKERGTRSKAAVQFSEQLGTIVSGQGFKAALTRKVLFNIPLWLYNLTVDALNSVRPILQCIPPVVDGGKVKAVAQKPASRMRPAGPYYHAPVVAFTPTKKEIMD